MFIFHLKTLQKVLLFDLVLISVRLCPNEMLTWYVAWTKLFYFKIFDTWQIMIRARENHF